MLEQGAEIRGYRIERLLGRGGMGEVYEATQLELGRRVAFKVLHSDLVGDEGFRQRFRREGRLQAALEHPNVVTVYEAGEIEEGQFIAMRLVDGGNLKELIGGDALDPERALRLLAPIADALDIAHEDGLVHRDVKPQNILVGAGDHPYLADFGLTRGRDQTAYTKSGHMVGTTAYISPEQIEGKPAVVASDIYALAGVLYECLTGSVPYPKPTDAAVIYAHVNDEPPAVRQARPDLPSGIDVVIARGLAKRPGDRPARAGDLIGDAAGQLGIDLPALPPRPPRRTEGPGGGGSPATTRISSTPVLESGRETPTRVSARRPGVAPVLAIAGVLAVGFLALLLGRSVGGEKVAELDTLVSGPTVSIRAPGDWSPRSSQELPAIPGLGLRDAIGAAPEQSSGVGVEAGTTDAENTLLLPPDFLRRVVGRLPEGRPVKLGELEALRYEGLTVRGFDRELTLYASPTTVGAATVACYSLLGGAELGATCESIAQSVELTSGGPYPLAVSEEASRALAGVVKRADRRTRAGRRSLARADTAEGQAAAAERISAGYARAANALARLDLSPTMAGEVAAIKAALDAAASSYDQLAAAAEGGDRDGFEAAAARVARSEARLDRVLNEAGSG